MGKAGPTRPLTRYSLPSNPSEVKRATRVATTQAFAESQVWLPVEVEKHQTWGG